MAHILFVCFIKFIIDFDDKTLFRKAFEHDTYKERERERVRHEYCVQIAIIRWSIHKMLMKTTLEIINGNFFIALWITSIMYGHVFKHNQYNKVYQ